MGSTPISWEHKAFHFSHRYSDSGTEYINILISVPLTKKKTWWRWIFRTVERAALFLNNQSTCQLIIYLCTSHFNTDSSSPQHSAQWRGVCVHVNIIFFKSRSLPDLLSFFFKFFLSSQYYLKNHYLARNVSLSEKGSCNSICDLHLHPK